MDATEIAAATAEPLGDDWGEPLWRLESLERAPDSDQPAWTLDVHGTDEKTARANALAALEQPAAQSVEEKLATALEQLPDGPVSKKDLAGLIGILRAEPKPDA